ncbi:MAG: trypsin-like peptidase domain-containing protein [Acidimicrobiales bacterium]
MTWVLVVGVGLGAGAAPVEARPAHGRRPGHPAAQPPLRPVALPVLSDLLDRTGLSPLLDYLLGWDLSAPPSRPVPLAVVARVTASTVRVSGRACGFTVAGSGFSPAPDTVVTNAHVVAGMVAPQVLRPDGRGLAATVQVFDPDRDVAVLSVPGLAEPSLPLGEATVGETGAIFGHPGGQAAVEVLPARVDRDVPAQVDNLYGTPVDRRILVLTARVRPGDSGAPLVDPAGRVVGMAFAVSSLNPSRSFAIARDEIDPVLAQPRTGAVSTGPCLS